MQIVCFGDSNTYGYDPRGFFGDRYGTNNLLQGASAKEAAARMKVFLTLLPNCKQLLLVAPPPMKRGAWVPTDALVAEFIHLAEEYSPVFGEN